MNIEDEISRISKEMTEDGTLDKMIRDGITKAYTSALDSAFGWGDLHSVIEKKIKEVMVPAIENADISEYAVKLDAVLIDIIKETALPDTKKILENFKTIMKTDLPKTITLDDILEQYANFCEKEIDCTGRTVNTDDEPSYVYGMANVEVTEDESCSRRYSYSDDKYAVLSCHINDDEDNDNKEKLNRKINLRHYSWEEEGYLISTEYTESIRSLRYMSTFDVWLMALAQNRTRIIADFGDEQCCEFEPEQKPEPDWT